MNGTFQRCCCLKIILIVVCICLGNGNCAETCEETCPRKKNCDEVCEAECQTDQGPKKCKADQCLKKCKGLCSPCTLNPKCGRILLFDGGFTGQIHNSKSYGSALNGKTCILSFETNSENITNKNCNFSQSGVWLLYTNNSYQINITRQENLIPTVPICFVNGTQNFRETTDMLTNYSQPEEGSTWSCGNITCLDPKTICDTAEYRQSYGSSSNDNIITFRGSTLICTKAGNAFKKTDGEIKIDSPFPVQETKNDNISYSDLMNNLNKMILKKMQNKSSLSVSMNNISGIFVKKESYEDLKSMYFTYSDTAAFQIIEDDSQIKTLHNAFSVPKEAFEKAVSMNNSTLFAGLFRFPEFAQDNKSSILRNNEAYSIDMGAHISNLTNTFNLTFKTLDPNEDEPLCHSWNGQGSTPEWTTDGCNTSYIEGNIVCTCKHLTFFAILMTPQRRISNSDLTNLTTISSIGCGVSLFFLSIALFMHFLLRRNQASISIHILMNLFLALFLLNFSFLINESVANTDSEIGCKLMAGVMHYSMLSTFTWFGLQALHLCLQLGQNVARIQHYITKVCIVGWVPPALVVTGLYIFQKYNKEEIISNTGKNISMCWINDESVHYAVNIGYYSAIFLFTVLTFVVMLRWLFLLRSKLPVTNISKNKSKPSDALTIISLCSILGLSWGFAFFAYGPMQIPAFYIFTIFNSLQGFFLFIYYYKSSQLIGETDESTISATEASMIVNPYDKPKIF